MTVGFLYDGNPQFAEFLCGSDLVRCGNPVRELILLAMLKEAHGPRQFLECRVVCFFELLIRTSSCIAITSEWRTRRNRKRSKCEKSSRVSPSIVNSVVKLFATHTRPESAFFRLRLLARLFGVQTWKRTSRSFECIPNFRVFDYKLRSCLERLPSRGSLARVPFEERPQLFDWIYQVELLLSRTYSKSKLFQVDQNCWFNSLVYNGKAKCRILKR